MYLKPKTTDCRWVVGRRELGRGTEREREGESVRVGGKVISEFVETASGQTAELPVPSGFANPDFETDSVARPEVRFCYY